METAAMDRIDMDRIEKRVLIRAPRARVWRAITDPGEFSKWFHVEIEGTLAPGARPSLTSTYEGPHKGVKFSFEVQEVVPERLFSWRWHPVPPPPGAGESDMPTTLVEFRLEDAEGGTMLTVTESGFDRVPLEQRAAAFRDHEGGWEIQTNSLRSYVG